MVPLPQIFFANTSSKKNDATSSLSISDKLDSGSRVRDCSIAGMVIDFYCYMSTFVLDILLSALWLHHTQSSVGHGRSPLMLVFSVSETLSDTETAH
jgi:hypothetical protein